MDIRLADNEIHWRWDCKGFQVEPFLQVTHFIPINFNFEPLIIRHETRIPRVDIISDGVRTQPSQPCYTKCNLNGQSWADAQADRMKLLAMEGCAQLNPCTLCL